MLNFIKTAWGSSNNVSEPEAATNQQTAEHESDQSKSITISELSQDNITSLPEMEEEEDLYSISFPVFDPLSMSSSSSSIDLPAASVSSLPRLCSPHTSTTFPALAQQILCWYNTTNLSLLAYQRSVGRIQEDARRHHHERLVKELCSGAADSDGTAEALQGVFETMTKAAEVQARMLGMRFEMRGPLLELERRAEWDQEETERSGWRRSGARGALREVEWGKWSSDVWSTEGP